MGIEEKAGDMGVVTTSLEAMVNWGRTNAMWPLLFGLACCAIEMMSAQGANYDLSRFGMELNRASPRQADLMIVAGRVSRKMAPVLRRLYDQMPDPKWVIAMGDCAACGGVFNNYAIVQGVDEVVPVDVYFAGCPPRPEALIDGIMMLHAKVRREKITGKKEDAIVLQQPLVQVK
ncbi:NADH-quinone oxidoreductase subunit B [Chloroflexales bacterium ZM16-3]|nr:NADH-quinone oxidoreductase subunit B [Chloroflexales bacterium ZM16-3]